MEGTAQTKFCDVQRDLLRQIEWETGDVKGVGEEFQQTTCFDTGSVADEFDWHVSVDDFVFTHGVEVHVQNRSGERIVLHVLDQSEESFLGVFDFEGHENLFADAVRKHGQDGFALKADVDAGLLFSINDSRDEAFFTEAIEGTGTATFAGVCFQDLRFSHGVLCCFLKVNPCIRQGSAIGGQGV